MRRGENNDARACEVISPLTKLLVPDIVEIGSGAVYRRFELLSTELLPFAFEDDVFKMDALGSMLLLVPSRCRVAAQDNQNGRRRHSFNMHTASRQHGVWDRTALHKREQSARETALVGGRRYTGECQTNLQMLW